jgi:hypothetical protein
MILINSSLAHVGSKKTGSDNIMYTTGWLKQPTVMAQVSLRFGITGSDVISLSLPSWLWRFKIRQ